MTWEFLKRWREEERTDCKTPFEWRLTLEIRREFVKTMRTVALLSMFSRDPITIANAQSALKTMGQLEPDLIFPPLLERAYPALETLTEVSPLVILLTICFSDTDHLHTLPQTHRTTAAITALSTVSPILVSRNIYASGAKHLLPLLELCLPGLDVNDPIKTMSTGIFVLQACSQVVIDDLTRPEVQPTSPRNDESGAVGGTSTPMTLDYNGEERSNLKRVHSHARVPSIELDAGETENGDGVPKLSREEEDDEVRTMTAGFPDWVSSFFRGVLAVFDALPEPGKGNKSGGKMEDSMTQTLTVREALSLHSLFARLPFDDNPRLRATSSVVKSLIHSSTSLSISFIGR